MKLQLQKGEVIESDNYDWNDKKRVRHCNINHI